MTLKRLDTGHRKQKKKHTNFHKKINEAAKGEQLYSKGPHFSEPIIPSLLMTELSNPQF